MNACRLRQLTATLVVVFGVLVPQNIWPGPVPPTAASVPDFIDVSLSDVCFLCCTYCDEIAVVAGVCPVFCAGMVVLPDAERTFDIGHRGDPYCAVADASRDHAGPPETHPPQPTVSV